MLQQWICIGYPSSANNILLNSVFIQFLTKKNYVFGRIKIKESSSVKFIGLTVGSGLSWSSHTFQLCSKLSWVNYPLIDSNALVMFYYGCLYSVMTHRIKVLGGSPHVSKVFLVQDRAVCIIKGLPPLRSIHSATLIRIILLALPFIFRLS